MLSDTEPRQFPSDKNLAHSFCKDHLYVTQDTYSAVPLLITESRNNWGWKAPLEITESVPLLHSRLHRSSPRFWISPRIAHQFSNDITFIFIFGLVEAWDSFPLHFNNVGYRCLQPVFIKIRFLNFLWSNDHRVLVKTWAGPCVAPWKSAWLPILYL